MRGNECCNSPPTYGIHHDTSTGPSKRPGFTAVRWGPLVAATITLAGLLVLGLAAGTPAGAAGTTWYAYAKGGATSPTTCPQSTTASQQCTLAQALSFAGAGDTVALATPGKTGHYVGNWTVNPAGTSSSTPLSIEPASGVSNPVLDGNHGSAAHCGTTACNGPVLTVGTPPGPLSAVRFGSRRCGHPGVECVRPDPGLTVENANSVLAGSTGGEAGAMMVSTGTHVTVTNDLFLHNRAFGDGGAIDNLLGGTVSVSDTAFLADSATDGAGPSRMESMGVARSPSRLPRLAQQRQRWRCHRQCVRGIGDGHRRQLDLLVQHGGHGGGAIDDGASGVSTLTVSGSTFVGNLVKTRAQGLGGGGAIDIAEGGAVKAAMNVSGSTFIGNSAHYGGAFNEGKATGTVSGSTFSANSAPYGGAITNGITSVGLSPSRDPRSRPIVPPGTAVRSTTARAPAPAPSRSRTPPFGATPQPAMACGVDSSVVNGDGGAIDNADNGGLGTVVVSASTFSGNVAKHTGGTVANDGVLVRGWRHLQRLVLPVKQPDQVE